MNKLREAVKSNTKTPQNKDNAELLGAIRGGGGAGGWINASWTKKF